MGNRQQYHTYPISPFQESAQEDSGLPAVYSEEFPHQHLEIVPTTGANLKEESSKVLHALRIMALPNIIYFFTIIPAHILHHKTIDPLKVKVTLL